MIEDCLMSLGTVRFVPHWNCIFHGKVAVQKVFSIWLLNLVAGAPETVTQVVRTSELFTVLVNIERTVCAAVGKCNAQWSKTIHTSKFRIKTVSGSWQQKRLIRS